MYYFCMSSVFSSTCSQPEIQLLPCAVQRILDSCSCVYYNLSFSDNNFVDKIFPFQKLEI
jgi:hypothetical protein